jgi:hypothetical protein
MQGKGTPTTTRDLAQDNNCVLPALPIYKVKLNIIITLNIRRAWGGGERFLHLLLKSGKDLTPIHRHKIHPTLKEYVWHPFSSSRIEMGTFWEWGPGVGGCWAQDLHSQNVPTGGTYWAKHLAQFGYLWFCLQRRRFTLCVRCHPLFRMKFY